MLVLVLGLMLGLVLGVVRRGEGCIFIAGCVGEDAGGSRQARGWS